MNIHRLFIAINIPERIKNRFEDYENKWPELPAKWTKPENLHITLLFLGNVAEGDIPTVLTVVKYLARKYQPFFLKLNKISYGPPKKIPPRMVWILAEKNPVLEQLKNEIEKGLAENNVTFQIEDRGFTPHITFARMNAWELREMEQEEVPQIDEDISYDFEVKSMEVMESEMKKFGAKYEVLASCRFGSEGEKEAGEEGEDIEEE